MRARNVRVFGLLVVFLCSLYLSAQPAKERPRPRDQEPPHVRVIKRLWKGVISLGDNLTLPKP
jgi:hypothetical protein